MVKETKAERAVREAVEKQVRQDQLRNSYLPRLMRLLECAQELNFELTVKNGAFELADRDERDSGTVTVPTTYEGDDWDSGFAQLERKVEWKEERNAEKTRKFLAKQAALAKLSKEEKELLGL